MRLIEWLAKRLYRWQWSYGQDDSCPVVVSVSPVVLADVVVSVPVASFVVDVAD